MRDPRIKPEKVDTWSHLRRFFLAETGLSQVTARHYNGMHDGMSRMTHRTTFALDHETATRLRRLAAAWQVSQAEVVRRSVAIAEESVGGGDTAASLLQTLHTSGKGLVREKAQGYLATLRSDRQDWRRNG